MINSENERLLVVLIFFIQVSFNFVFLLILWCVFTLELPSVPPWLPWSLNKATTVHLAMVVVGSTFSIFSRLWIVEKP